MHASNLMQIHYMEDGSVQIYGRNTQPITGKYPDVVSSVSRCANLEQFSTIVVYFMMHDHIIHGG